MKSTIIRGATYTVIGQFISKIFTYIYRILIARLGTEIYGIFSILLAIVGMSTRISLIGLITGVQRFISFYYEKKELNIVKNVLYSSLELVTITSTLLIFGIIMFSRDISIFFLKNQDFFTYVVIFSIAIILMVYREIINSAFLGFKKIEYVFYTRDLIDSVSKLIITYAFIVLGFHLSGVIAGYLIANFVVIIASIYLLKKIFSEININNISVNRNIHIYKELLHFSLPLLIANYIFMVVKWADTLMLGYFKSTKDVGIYNAANPTAMLILFLPSAILSLFLSEITGFYARGNLEYVKNVYLKVTKWIVIMNFPILFFITAFSNKILSLFGKDYITGSTSLFILSLGYFFFSAFWASSHIIMMVKKTHVSMIISIIVTTANLILNFLLIPVFGINGASTATAIAIALNGILHGIFSYKYIKAIPFNVNLAIFKIINIIFVFLIWYFKSLYILFVAILTFVVMLFGLKITNIAEIKDLFKKIFNI